MLTASILVAKVWESPHVPETHAESHLSQHILDFRVPRRPVVVVGCLGSIQAVGGGQLSFRAALAKPGSVLQTVQWRLLILVTQNTKHTKFPSNICPAAEVKPAQLLCFFQNFTIMGENYLKTYVIRLI